MAMSKKDALAVMGRIQESATVIKHALSTIAADYDLTESCGPDIDDSLDNAISSVEELAGCLDDVVAQIKA